MRNAKKLKKRCSFFIFLFLLGSCLSLLIRPMASDVEKDTPRSDQSGEWLLRKKWITEHHYSGQNKKGKNPIKQDRQTESSYPSLNLSWILKYLFLVGEPIEKSYYGKVFHHQNINTQNESMSSWTHSPPAKYKCNKVNALFLLLIIAFLATVEKDSKKERHTSSSKPEKDALNRLKSLKYKFINYVCPEISLNKRMIVDKPLNSKTNVPWMYEPLGRVGQFMKYNVFSVLERVATFRALVANPSNRFPSVLPLAEAGFIYTGVGTTVECKGCKNQVDVKEFISPAVEGRYHRERCSFSKVDTNETSQENFATVDANETSHDNFATVDANESSEEKLYDAEETNSQTSTTIKGEIETDGHDHNAGYTNASANVNALSNQVENEIPNILNQLPDNISNNVISSAACNDNHCELKASEQTLRNDAKVNGKQLENKATTSKQPRTHDPQHNNEQPTDIFEPGAQQPNKTSPAVQTLILPSVNQEEQVGACAASERWSAADVKKFNAKLFDLKEFHAEDACSSTHQLDTSDTCQKNSGHFGNFSVKQLNLDNIPRNVRHPDVLVFIQLLGKLVVRVVVRSKSIMREQKYCKLENTKFRFGTGFATINPAEKDSLVNKESTGKWNSVRKFIPGIKNKGYVYVHTVRHLVYDDSEAENTTVEFFFDDRNRSGVVVAKGVSIEHSKTLGDFMSTLKCKISDLSVVEFVRKTHNEIKERVGRFPQNIKEGLMKRVFVISHPHGGEKVMSYGEHVLVKYSLKTVKENGEDNIDMEKINNHTQISKNTDEIRKVLFYTADTCPGSSGGVVLFFQKIKVNNKEEIVMDLWTHCGVSKRHKLNASSMRELTADDIANYGTSTVSRPAIQDEQEMEADKAANREVSCPVYTVMGSPSHPAYVPYRKRLESYPNPFNHVHTGEDLADAGFFYAGYSDCVRCFHCGLGLRSWKPGDNIYEEHHKNRPDCMFLLIKMRATGIDQLGFQSHQQRQAPSLETTPNAATTSHEDSELSMMVQQPVSSPSSQAKFPELRAISLPTAQQATPNETVLQDGDKSAGSVIDKTKNTEVSVLEREQQYLKQLLVCKVCHKNPAKDLFLPCGELLACLECSKLLTHCPSCNSKILATVTTFFI